ncbi:hypothetical protein V8E55_003834 [Tylopilus felleus]
MDFDSEQQPAAPTQDFLATVKVFPLIPYLKKDVTSSIDTPLTWIELTATDVDFAVVRPLVQKYARLQNMAVVYACMVARSYFLSQVTKEMALSPVLTSRATLCEILALRLLACSASSKLQLVAVLTTPWNPLTGAPLDVVEEVKLVIGTEDAAENSQSAIEMAISTKAKAFLSSTIVQSVIDDMYTGRIVFTIAGNRSLLIDNYKQRAIEMYDVRKAPFLDHYRLRVPRYSNILHSLSIVILTLTFVLCLYTQQIESVSTWELVFLVFATAFTLQEYTASREYGWGIYISNVWNAFDTAFVLVFLAYVGLRTKGLVYHEAGTSKLAFDLLACVACVLVPRLAFYTIANNVIVLTLREMISEFVFFISICTMCFSGLLLTLYTLASGRQSVKSIAWMMMQMWFGNAGLSFAKASSFHPVIGPILMTCFAVLVNNFLLTILVSILTNTAMRFDMNANEEFLFQYAITTIEGVKSDALFSYQPPFNIVAFLILKPASYVLSPRALHTANVFLIKLTSFPILIVIALYERQLVSRQKKREFNQDSKQSIYQSLPRHLKKIPFVEHLVGSKSTDLYDVIFEVEESRDFNLFHDSENEDARAPSSAAASAQPASSFSGSPARGRTIRLDTQQTPSSARKRKISTLTPLEELSSGAKVFSLDTSTPLSKLFSPSRPATAVEQEGGDYSQRLQGLLDQYRNLPIRLLQDDMKEMQDRQRRIENLLLTLTPRDA